MVERLVSTILDGVMGGEKWGTALDEVCKEVGAKAAALQADDEEHKRRHIFGVSSFFRDQEGAALVEEYLRGDDKGDEDAYRAFASLPANKMILERSIFGLKSNAELPESDFRSSLISFGHETRNVAVLNPSGPWYDLLALTFGSEAEGETALTHPSVPLILDLLSKTIELQRIMSSLRRRYAAALAALDHLGLGVVLTNENAEILLINNEGQRILDSKDGLKANAQRQLVADGTENARMHSAIRAAIAPTSRKPAGADAPFSITRPSEDYDFLVSISPLRDADAELEPGLKAAFVLIVDPARSGSLDASGLILLGKLTTAEGEVANHLVSGSSIQEIAKVRDTSPLTVRGQVKNVSAKLRCRSQADIIRLAAVTRLPIIDD